MNNKMKLEFAAIPQNELLARNAVAAFASQMNPTIDQIVEMKTAVSEAVTNAIVHAYNERPGVVIVKANIIKDVIHIEISDKGCGIADIAKAVEPFFTTASERERSGMGFSVMQCFMDEMKVISQPNMGTKVKLKKRVGVIDEASN